VKYFPNRKHTYCSDVRLTVMPSTVPGTMGTMQAGGVATVDVEVKDTDGALLASAIPVVTITKYSRYSPFETGPKVDPDPMGEVEILARVKENLAKNPLAGFVTEGMSPYGAHNPTANAALEVGIFSGMPVVRCGRGNTGGMAYKQDPKFIAGNNLTSTKARMLLMAALLTYGALPPAADPFNPTTEETAATLAKVQQYQQVFDTH
jgi:L-asparaginase